MGFVVRTKEAPKEDGESSVESVICVCAGFATLKLVGLRAWKSR